MDQHSKLRLSRQVMLVSGIFCLLIAILLLLYFWQLKQHEPLESKTIEALVERLAADPGNEELKNEIREFDLLVRKAYFTGSWQVKSGAWLLLFGGILFVTALRIHTGLQKQIEPPEESGEKGMHAKWVTHRWLLASGFLVIALALVSAFLSHDHLKKYDPLMAAGEPAGAEETEVPVIRITDSAEEIPVKGEEDSTIPGIQGSDPDAAGDRTGTGIREEQLAEGERNVTGEKALPAGNFGAEDYKRNQNTFRGFLGQGISFHQNIPTEWDGASGINVRWKVAISKPGYNSPVIWGDQVFIAGADEQTRIVASYDRHTGLLLWERQADGIPGSPTTLPRVSEDTGLSAPTMAVDGLGIYAIFATGDLIAFDLEGNRKWARNLGVPENHYGHSSSLMVWKDKLIIQYDTGKGGRMLAVNTVTGETAWDISRDNQIAWSSPILIQVNDNIQIVTSTDPYVAGYDVETGSEIWKAEVVFGEVGPSPAFSDGLVFATQDYARLAALKPEPGTEILWENDEHTSDISSPVASEGLIYLATSYGVLVCYDAFTGEKYWEKEFNNVFTSSPMIVDNMLYVIDMRGITHILKADRSGTIISEPELGEDVFAVPAFAEGRIYIRGEESLYCIEQN